MADNGSSGVNALAIVAILAILVGLALAVWFFMIRTGGSDKDINVDLNPSSSVVAEPFEYAA
jgi:hypothetical protein